MRKPEEIKKLSHNNRKKVAFAFNSEIKIKANGSICKEGPVRSTFQISTFFAQRGDLSSCLLLTSF